MILLYETIFAISVLALFMIILYMLYIIFFEHDHDNGHCGYSGCQEDLEKVKQNDR